MSTVNRTTRRILAKPLSPRQQQMVEAVSPEKRLGALWRTLKYGHPWPRHRGEVTRP